MLSKARCAVACTRLRDQTLAPQGIWRIALAFDPDRQAMLLVGGDKSGGSEKRFHKQLIARADVRFDRHLEARKG